jgi:hypothetical protein
MAVTGGLFNYLTQSPAAGPVAVQKLLAPLPPVGATPQFSLYDSLASKQVPRPYAVLHIVDAPPAAHSLDGPSSLIDGEFQFDSYGDSQQSARQFSQAIRDALKNFSGALNDGTTIQFFEVSMDVDLPYELGGNGYLYRSMVRLRAFYTEPGT